MLPVIWYLRRREKDRAEYRLHDFCLVRTWYDFVCRIVFPAGWSAVYHSLKRRVHRSMYMVFMPIFGSCLAWRRVWSPGSGMVAATGLYLLGVDINIKWATGICYSSWSRHLGSTHTRNRSLYQACARGRACRGRYRLLILGIFVSKVFAGESTAWSQLVAAGPALFTQE